MKRFYSKTTEVTYLEGLHPEMPADSVEISDEVFMRVIANPDPSKVRSHDNKGFPVLIDRPAPTMEDLAEPERRWRDAELSMTDRLVARHRDEVDDNSATTLAEDQYKGLQAYRSALRDWPEAKAFPDSAKRPESPDWFS